VGEAGGIQRLCSCEQRHSQALLLYAPLSDQAPRTSWLHRRAAAPAPLPLHVVNGQLEAQ
jgi:hypothetical protein